MSQPQSPQQRAAPDGAPDRPPLVAARDRGGRLLSSPIQDPDIIRVGWSPDNHLHNFLVFLYHLARLPLWLAALLVAAFLALGALPHPAWGPALALLAAASLADLLLLALLPRCGISYGWIQPPWLLYALGRAALASALGLLPLPPATGLWLLGALQLTLTLLSLYGSLVEPFWLAHTELQVPLPGLTAPVRLLLLTDLHVERLTRRERRLLREVERGAPEVILLGGDLLNLSYIGEPRAVAESRTLLAGLHAPGGVFFVRGTVDIDPKEVVQQQLQGLDIEQLEVTPRLLQLSGGRVCLVGIPAEGTPAQRQERLAQAMAQATPGCPVICLHHTPDLVEQAAAHGAALYLAGHTHGGQICLPLLGPVATASRLGRRYFRGRYQLGRTTAYVSRGVGLEGLGAPRMRFLARPELVWITLTPAPAAPPAAPPAPAPPPLLAPEAPGPPGRERN